MRKKFIFICLSWLIALTANADNLTLYLTKYGLSADPNISASSAPYYTTDTSIEEGTEVTIRYTGNDNTTVLSIYINGEVVSSGKISLKKSFPYTFTAKKNCFIRVEGNYAFNFSTNPNVYFTQDVDVTLDEATDNSTALSTANGKVCDVTLTRTLQTGGYNTFAVPFAISSAKMTELGITAKKLTASDFNSMSGTLTLTFSSASEIEAGKPYLVKVSANVVSPTFSGVTVSSTAVPNTETTAVNFVPTLGKALVTGDGSYASEPGSVLFLGSGNKLFSPTVVNDAEQEASYMKGFRAYFQLKGTAASARAFNIDFGDGETTGIKEIYDLPIYDLQFNSSSCYDLSGRKIVNGKLQKGVYIVNGKKTVIK